MMFPASILLPRAVFFVVSGKKRYRDCRTPAHGLLAISSMWVIGFFSLSECKLPAYILPAVPMLALLIGVVFEYEFNRMSDSRTRFDKLAKRIALGMSIMIALMGAAILFWIGDLGDHAISAVVIAVLVAVAFPIAIKKRNPRRVAPWLATGAIALAFVFQGVNQLVPALSAERSILRGLANTDQILSDSPIVYFGRDTHAASIYVPEKRVIWFPEEDLESALDFLQKNRRASIVATDENLNRIRDGLPNASFGAHDIRHAFSFEINNDRIANSKHMQTDR
jgi:dolichol-phosphate mannosyltransferase